MSPEFSTPTTLSEVAICNLMLQDVGRGLTIPALDENSQAARACWLRYPFARDACLRAYERNFAAAQEGVRDEALEGGWVASR